MIIFYYRFYFGVCLLIILKYLYQKLSKIKPILLSVIPEYILFLRNPQKSYSPKEVSLLIIQKKKCNDKSIRKKASEEIRRKVWFGGGIQLMLLFFCPCGVVANVLDCNIEVSSNSGHSSMFTSVRYKPLYFLSCRLNRIIVVFLQG